MYVIIIASICIGTTIVSSGTVSSLEPSTGRSSTPYDLVRHEWIGDIDQKHVEVQFPTVCCTQSHPGDLSIRCRF